MDLLNAQNIANALTSGLATLAPIVKSKAKAFNSSKTSSACELPRLKSLLGAALSGVAP
jgi:hypothetical protein